MRTHRWLRLLLLAAALAGLFFTTGEADNAGVVGASIIFEDSPAGGGGAAECEPYCAPPLPALFATKTDELLVDLAENGDVDPGDTLRYRMLLGNTSPVGVYGVVYVERLDSNLQVVPDSWGIRSVDAAGNEHLRDAAGRLWRLGVDGSFLEVEGSQSQEEAGPIALTGQGAAQLLSLRLGAMPPNTYIEVFFDAVVAADLAGGVTGLLAQGTVFAETTSPVLTDDPSTGYLQDATWTPVGSPLRGTYAGGGGTVLPTGLVGAKQATVLHEPEVPRVVEPGGEVEYRIAYRNEGQSALEDVVLMDLVGPYLAVQSDSVLPSFARYARLGAVEVVFAEYERVEPGEWIELVYRVSVSPFLPPEIGFTGSRALASAAGTCGSLSDDTATQLLADPTTVLFPNRCVEQDWTWDDWQAAISEAPTGLFPLVLQEKDKSHHLRWVLYGGDFYGDLSVEPSSRPPLWPEWALVGLVEMDREVSPDQDPGFRLAQRQEDYVEAFLESEPFFMWADYGMPLYGRVPATDKGELLECEGFDRFFCDPMLLPLLVTLDWSREWDMRWLEDDLIVATRMDSTEMP